MQPAVLVQLASTGPVAEAASSPPEETDGKLPTRVETWPFKVTCTMAPELSRQLSSPPSVHEAGATASPESATSKLPSGATVIFFGWLSPLAITWT